MFTTSLGNIPGNILGRSQVTTSHFKAKASFACILKDWAVERARATTFPQVLSPAELVKAQKKEKNEWCAKVGLRGSTKTSAEEMLKIIMLLGVTCCQ